MNRIFVVATVLVLAIPLGLSAQEEYEIPFSVVGAGGSATSDTLYTVIGTLGQPVIGVTTGFSHMNEIGFWYHPGWIIHPGVEDDPGSWRYALERNYPNPFNPITTFSFALPTRTHATIRLYNIAGREVRTLLDKEVDAGQHRAVLNASGLPSGVYFCRMVAGDFEGIRKVVLLK